MPNEMDREYVAWTGRKTTALRRPKLDCGHPKGEDVHFHLWCDRLSCSPECADATHDCGKFKGKSGIEEEAVEPEVFPAPLGAPVATGDSSPEARRQFLADVAAFHALLVTAGTPPIQAGESLRVTDVDGTSTDYTVEGVDLEGTISVSPAGPHPSFTLADMEAASAAVRARRPWICPRCRTEFSWDLPGLRRLHEANGCEQHDGPVEPSAVPWWRRMLGGTR